MGFSNKPILVDGRGHLLGRLAAVVAKRLLQGEKIIVVRCERLNISGNMRRNHSMLPHKTKRGLLALKNLTVTEGIPPPYDKKKRMVLPCAMRVVRLDPNRPYTDLGKLASRNGWKYRHIVSLLESKRKIRGKIYFNKEVKLRSAAKKLALKMVSKKIAPVQKIIESYGYF